MWSNWSNGDVRVMRVRGQASSIKDLKEWPMLLAAIMMYTFDLSLLFLGIAQEENYYFRINQVKKNQSNTDPYYSKKEMDFFIKNR